MIHILLSAWSMVTRRRLGSTLAVLGVAISVCALTSIMSVEDSWRKAVIEFFAPMDLETVKVVHPAEDDWRQAGFRRPSLDISDVKAIRAECPAVQSVTPTVVDFVLVETRDFPQEMQLRAVPADFVKALPDQAREGRLFTAEEEARRSPVCLLSYQARLNLFGAEPAIGQRIRVQRHLFTVVGVISGYQRAGIATQAVYIPIGQERALVNWESFCKRQMEIFARAQDPRAASEQIERLMRERVGGDGSRRFTESLWEGREQSMRARAHVTLYSGLAGLCALIAAGIGIAALMFVSVAERSWEIGICRALGASRRVVCAEYILAAAILALLGGLLGGVLAIPASAMGVFATKWQPVTGISGAALELPGGGAFPSISDIAVSVSWRALGTAIVLALLNGVIAALAPASEAAGISPARAIARRAGAEARPRKLLTCVQVGFGVVVLVLLTSYFSLMETQDRAEARKGFGQDSISAVVDPIAAMSKPCDDRYVRRCSDAVSAAIASPGMMSALRRTTPLLGSVTPSIERYAAIAHGSHVADHTPLLFASGEAFDYEPALPADTRHRVAEAFRAGQAVAVISPGVKSTFFGRADAIGRTVTVAGRKFTIVAVHDCLYSLRGITSMWGNITIPSDFYEALESRMERDGPASAYSDARVLARPLDTRRYPEAAAQFRDALLPLLPAEYRKTIEFSEEIPETTRQYIFQQKSVAARGAIGALAVLLVALIGLANMLLVSVHGSIRETGLRRALGAQRSDVFWHFLAEGVLLSAVGAGVGLALGALMCFAAGKWMGLPITLSAFWAVAGAVATVLGGLVVSLPPAVIATRVRPAEALRYE